MKKYVEYHSKEWKELVENGWWTFKITDMDGVEIAEMRYG